MGNELVGDDRAVAIAQPLLDRCGKACRRVLKDAELTREQLDGVILVGGSTRSPVVRDYVAKLFEKQPLCDLDPEQVVALGRCKRMLFDGRVTSGRQASQRQGA